MIVITVGKSYIDIDGYASSIAYRELLKLRGIESKFVSKATLNYSITNTLLEMPFCIDEYEVKEDDKFIILDISNREFFPEFVEESNIIEIIDHHPGNEEYWKDKSNVQIEEIGSVATIIYEKYVEYNMLSKMDKGVAKLLMAAILDNTLNFTAKITKQRDIDAYKELEKITGDYDFASNYFSESENTIVGDLETAITGDIKKQKTNSYLPELIGQLTIWNIDKILDKNSIIRNIMNACSNKWIINVISLKENKSYILCSDNDVRNTLNSIFNTKTFDLMLVLEPAKLRKEIIKFVLNAN